MKKHPSGHPLLTDPIYNKGTAFTTEERTTYRIHGLIPYQQDTLDEQRARAYHQLQAQPSDIEKHVYLRGLQDSNEVLFYNVLTHHIEELLPIVYTPVVGEGCVKFSHIYRHPRGLFVSYPLKDQMKDFLNHASFDQVRAIVVTDGSRILGLGDLGMNGLGIPIGKLSLYTTCAGIHPAQTLPIVLDAGTDNETLLKDPIYLGWRHPRVSGKDYDDFIDLFVQTIQKRFPHVLLQWEDFAIQKAYPILERYRNQLCTFNDDIQGTAAVVTGTLLAAMKASGVPLTQQRIAVLGGGSAGCGISSLLLAAMIDEGLDAKAAKERFFLVDQLGLLDETHPNLLPFQKPFAKKRNDYAHWKLKQANTITMEDVINNVHPTILIGVCGVGGAFTESMIKNMAQHVEHPIIFPLSNPTTHAEATPQDLLAWTNGKAIISTGSPFGTITYAGNTHKIDQTNNVYIFPGMGLGVIAARAKHVSDKMFMASAKALAECSPAIKNPKGNLLPALTDIKSVSQHIAIAVAQAAKAEGLSSLKDNASIEKEVEALMWEPRYPD